jgi:(R,R)-butanediol dehydrogenase/meso-butanediol dehydrogenase/diacetyl reductase/L-iditol 2-dehydrogenase
MKYCGTCVFCRTGKENFCQNKKPTMNGMSEYICWHMSQVYKLPPQVDLKQGALTEPVSIAFGAVEMVKVKLGSRVAIFGGGGIGLIALQVARLAGAAQIVVIEPVAAKREMALKLGADIVIVPQEEDIKAISDKLTDKLGFDCIIEASGAVSAATAALDILTPDGDLVYFSMYDPSYTLPLNLFWQEYWQQKHIHGMFNTADIFPRVLAVLGRLNLDMMMQKEYPLLEYEKAFADQLSGNFAKVVLKCN